MGSVMATVDVATLVNVISDLYCFLR